MDIIRGGYNGRLFRPDDPEDLARQIAGLIVGNTNNANSMTIAGGGSLTVNGPVVVGLGSNSASNVLSLTGGVLNANGDLYVGSNGPGNTLVINGGASVAVASNTYIGFGTNSTGNLLSVNGGSLSNGGTVNIGYGGSGTLAGPVVGSFAVVLLPEYLRIADSYRLITYGFILVLATIFLPRGLVPVLGAAVGAGLRRLGVVRHE